MQLRHFELWFEPIPNRDRQILSCWNRGLKFSHFFIQKPVVDGIDHFAVHDFLEFLQIDHKAGMLIHGAFDCYFQGVIVTMTMRIIALSKNPLVRSEEHTSE